MIKAQNDGQATVITNSSAPACFINSKSYVDLEGIICVGQGSTYYRAVDVTASSHINLRRISAYNKSGEDGSGFQVDDSSYVLIEDGVAMGNCRKQYNIQSDDHVTLRRCWASFDNWLGTGSAGDLGTLTIYGSSNCIVENCIVTRTPSSTGTIHGIHNWANTGQTASNNVYYGNVVYGLTDWAYLVNRADASVGSENNIFTNNVGINNLRGFDQRADTNMTVTNLTMAGTTSATVGAYQVDASGTVTGVIGNVTNSSLYGSAGYGFYRVDSTLNHSYNNLYSNASGDYNGTTAGTGEKTLNPAYDTATYGKGAYLMVPTALQGQGESGADIGAEVLYRYVDGVLTSVALWPWPMESRICDETGYSVSYATGYTGCALGGGIWKTLDGVYSGDSTPPTLPGDPTISHSVQNYNNIHISWNAASDDIGVVKYYIYRCDGTCTPADPGDYLAEVPGVSYDDLDLPSSTSFSYNVKALDASGNKSNFYTAASETTSTPPGGSNGTAIKKSRTIVVDGNCEDFTEAPTIVDGNMRLRLLYDATEFCGCATTSDIQINAQHTTDDDNQFLDDSLEMAFDTNNDGGSSMTSGDYKLTINVLGNKMDSDYTGIAGWNPTVTIATQYGKSLNNNTDTDSSYSIEFCITWANWGISAPTDDVTVWGFDFNWNNLNPPNLTQTPWNNSDGDGFNDPDGWGTLQFATQEGATVSAVNAGSTLSLSGNTLKLGL
jgi:hypothetical protein